MDEIDRIDDSSGTEFEWVSDQVANGQVNGTIEAYLRQLKKDALADHRLLDCLHTIINEKRFDAQKLEFMQVNGSGELSVACDFLADVMNKYNFDSLKDNDLSSVQSRTSVDSEDIG